MNWIKKFFIENKCLIIRLYKNILSSSSNHHSFTIAKKISMKIVLLFLSSNTFCVIPLNPLPNADWYCQHFLIQNIIFQDWKLFKASWKQFVSREFMYNHFFLIFMIMLQPYLVMLEILFGQYIYFVYLQCLRKRSENVFWCPLIKSINNITQKEWAFTENEKK